MYVLSVQYSCAVVSFFFCGGKVLLRPEKKVLVVCLAGCAVVSFFLLWRESNLVYNVQLCCCVSFLVVAGNGSY